MTLNLTEDELLCLEEILDKEFKCILREINHVDTAAYKNRLKHKMHLLDQMRCKLAREASGTSVTYT